MKFWQQNRLPSMPSQKWQFRSSETAWPGRFTQAIFEPYFSDPRCQKGTFKATIKNTASVSFRSWKHGFDEVFGSRTREKAGKTWFHSWNTISMKFWQQNRLPSMSIPPPHKEPAKNDSSAAAKQHGLVDSRRPFSNHISPTPDVKKALNPL